MSRNSTYSTGKTVDEVADSWIADIKEGVRSVDPDDAITSEWGYGQERLRAVQVTLAGGGPAADITFLFAHGDYEPKEAFFCYYEDGATARYLPTWFACDVWNAMRRDPEQLQRSGK